MSLFTSLTLTGWLWLLCTVVSVLSTINAIRNADRTDVGGKIMVTAVMVTWLLWLLTPS